MNCYYDYHDLSYCNVFTTIKGPENTDAIANVKTTNGGWINTFILPHKNKKSKHVEINIVAEKLQAVHSTSSLGQLGQHSHTKSHQ